MKPLFELILPVLDDIDGTEDKSGVNLLLEVCCQVCPLTTTYLKIELFYCRQTIIDFPGGPINDF